MTSPRAKPAPAAGEPALDRWTRTPVSRRELEVTDDGGAASGIVCAADAQATRAARGRRG